MTIPSIMRTWLFSLLNLLTATLCAQETFIYVSDAGNWSNPPWQVLKYDMHGDFAGVFTEDEMAWPQDIVFLDSTALISNLNSGRVNIHDAATGDYRGVFASGLAGPTRMKIGQDSLLYVLQWSGNGRVKRYDLDGSFVDDYTDSSVAQAIGLDWDDQGHLYVSSFSQRKVERFDQDGSWVETFIDSGLAGPTNIWFGDTGQLYINDYSSGTIKHFNSNGQLIEILTSGINQCEGIAITAEGDWLIGDGGNAAVHRFNPDGTLIESLVSSGTGGLLRPNAVVLYDEAENDTIDTATSATYLKRPSVKIVPQVGDRFFIHEGIEEVRSVQIWDVKGNMIEKRIPDSNLVWDATASPSGVYFIIANLQDGELVRQRVVLSTR